jgi:hypothetical protein
MTRLERQPTIEAERCNRCGTVIDFLSTCPSCGTVAGIDPTLSDAASWARPHLTLVGSAMSSPSTAVTTRPAVVADAGTSRLPSELTRAWDTAVFPNKKSKRRLGTVLAIAVLVVVAAVGADVALKATAQPASSAVAAASGPQLVLRAFPAVGQSFRAALPAGAIRTTSRLALAGLPYTATTYSAASAGVSYSASVYPFPLGKPILTADQFLRSFTTNLAASRSLQIPGATFGTYKGLPSMSVVLASPDHQLYVNIFEVLDGHVEYVLAAYGTSYHVPGYAQLAASFHLLGR